MKTNTIITLLTLLIALTVFNFLATRHPVRLDLTKNKIYTLSDSTKKILSDLDDVATMRVYFTEDLPPTLQPLRRDVDDLLAEFKRAAGSRIQVEHLDPGSSSLEEQRANMLGIPPVQLNVFNKDKQEVAKIYLGMAVMYGGRQQVIPVIQNTKNLEYQIAESLIKVSTKELKKIAWWTSNEVKEEDGFGIIKDLLVRRYDISEIKEDKLADLTPQNFSALVLASPRKLNSEELFAIDQYLMSGGRIVALVDRMDVDLKMMVVPVNTDAVDLIAGYGASIEDSLVLDEQDAMAAFAGGIVTYHVPYPYWPEVRGAGFDRSQAVTASLQSAVFPWTSPIVLSQDAYAAGTAKPLASTSIMSATVSGKDAKLDPQSANNFLRAGSHETRTLLATITGPFKSYFTQNDHIPPRNMKPKIESAEGAQIFVAGSSRWINDKFLQNFPQNAALFQNVLDLFAMSDLLIGIRSREDTSRALDAIPDSGRAALKYVNLAVGPLILVMIGFVTFVLRRRHQRAMARHYN